MKIFIILGLFAFAYCQNINGYEDCDDGEGNVGTCVAADMCGAMDAKQLNCKDSNKVCCLKACFGDLNDPCRDDDGDAGMCKQQSDCSFSNQGTCGDNYYCCPVSNCDATAGEGQRCEKDASTPGVCSKVCGTNTKSRGQRNCMDNLKCCSSEL